MARVTIRKWNHGNRKYMVYTKPTKKREFGDVAEYTVGYTKTKKNAEKLVAKHRRKLKRLRR